MEQILLWPLLLFGLVNLYAFFLMLDDKRKARRNQARTSEGDLLFAAICLGALGIYLGMFVARHKTQKLIFLVGVPLALLENLALLYLLYTQLV